MPPDTLTISLTGPLADEVRAAAKARGVTPDELVREQVADGLAFEAEHDDLSWEEDLRRMEEPGANASLDDAFDRLDARIKSDKDR